MTTFRCATLIILLMAAPLAAQQSDTMAQSSATDSSNSMSLSLDKAISIAVERNLGVKIEKLNTLEAEQSARSSLGQFDLLASATLQKVHTEQAVTSVIYSPTSDTDTGNLSLRQNLPTGGNYSVTFNNNKLSSPNSFRTFNPSFNSDLTLGVTQPLLKNFGVDVTTRNVRIARNTLGIRQETFETQMTQTVLSVQQAYLDLVYARQNLDVVKESLFLAKDQARITQIRIDVGASAPLDILQPNVDIATREENQIVAEAAIRNAEDRLRQLLNLPAEDWNKSIIPTDDVAFNPVTIDVDEAVKAAYANRPEIRSAELSLENAKIDHVYRRNQRLPQVDLRFDYGLGGTGGTQIRDFETNEPITPIPGGYGDAFDQVTGFDFPSWTVAFDVSMPIRNTQAKAEAKRAKLELERQASSLEQTRQTIVVEVRQAVRDIDTAARSIAASKASRDAAEKNLDAERKRFDNGMTTNFQVLQAQSDLSSARSREISALVQYNKALAVYHKAIGDLLDVHDIEVEGPETMKIPYSGWSKFSFLNYGHSSK